MSFSYWWICFKRMGSFSLFGSGNCSSSSHSNRSCKNIFKKLIIQEKITVNNFLFIKILHHKKSIHFPFISHEKIEFRKITLFIDNLISYRLLISFFFSFLSTCIAYRSPCNRIYYKTAWSTRESLKCVMYDSA